jgi:hypothetical protein
VPAFDEAGTTKVAVYGNDDLITDWNMAQPPIVKHKVTNGTKYLFIIAGYKLVFLYRKYKKSKQTIGRRMFFTIIN